MNKLLKKVDAWHSNDIFWIVVTASVLLAAWMQYIQHGWINPDTLLYFEHARLISLGDWHGAMAVYPWPFYGAAIAAVHKLGFDIHFAAQLLNMLFFGMAMAGFIKIIQLAGGANRAMLAGTFLIFGSQYIVGDVLEMLMRDEGFWAFYLFAIFFFIRFFLFEKTKDAILWQIFIGFAALFRIEALMYAALLPLSWLMRHEVDIKTRIQKLLVSYSVSIFLLSTLLIIIGISTELSMQDFGRLNEIFTSNLLTDLIDKLTTHAHKMSKLVLGNYLEEYAIESLLITFLYILIIKVITTTGVVGAVLAYLGIRSSQMALPKPIYMVMLSLLIISFLSMYFTVIKVFVLSSRYVVPTAWVLLFFAAMYWANLNQRKPSHWIHIIITITMLLGFTKNVLPKRDGYNYQQDAVAWLRTYRPSNTRVFYDDARVRYYAGAPFVGKNLDSISLLTTALKNGSIHDYQVIMLSSSKKNLDGVQLVRENLPNFRETIRFSSSKKDKQLIIYEKASSLNNNN